MPSSGGSRAGRTIGGWLPAQGRARVTGLSQEVFQALRGELAVQQAGELADFDEISAGSRM
jgi:hypothetical protein